MKNLFITILLLSNCLISAQNTFAKQSEVYKKISKIDIAKNKLLDTFHIEYDSINMNIKRYENIIETEGYVGKSKNLLKITYYIDLNQLQAIKTKETSPIMDDLYMHWLFNVENNKIVNEFPSHTVRVCSTISSYENWQKVYGYNEKWDANFLKELLMKLYDKIKNYR